MVTYGSEADPGVQWDVVHHDFTVESIVPAHTDMAAGASSFWNGDAFPQDKLLAPGKAALFNLKDFQGLPGMLVRISLFTCGGYAVGIRLAHPLADAVSLLTFVHGWAARSRSASSATPSSSLFGAPVFDPAALDARAAGDINAAEAGPDLAAAAHALPLHRFSWWDMDAPGYSPWLVDTTKNSMPSAPDGPNHAAASSKLAPSTVAPWHTWDLTRPVSFGLVHVSGEELRQLQRVARAGAPAAEAATISRTDALMAHVFRLVTRARSRTEGQKQHLADDEVVFLDVTLEARRRVDPPLPPTFVGSPLLLAHIGAAAAEVRGEGAAGDDGRLGRLAAQLRSTLARFTPDAVAAVLHDAAHEVSPQRLWRGFLGARHVLASSWQRLRVYEVDFEGKGEGKEETSTRPAYVHAVMQKCDGIVVILDPAVPDEGVDLAVYLDEEAMGHFREELAKWRMPLE